MPRNFLLDLHIAYLSYLWTTTLGDDDSTTNGQHRSPSHLISTFETQLSQLQERFGSFEWPSYLQIKFSGLRLQIYSFAINRPKQNTPTRGAPSMQDATLEVLQAKALSATIVVTTEVRKDAPSLGYWPVFARYNVLFAACIGVYMAGKITDTATRTALLETSKNDVQVLHGWAIYPRDNFARIAKYISIAIRRIETLGANGLLNAEEGSGRPIVTSRMAASIAFQLVWSAKHGKTPEPIPRPAPPVPVPDRPQIAVSQHINDAAGGSGTFQSQPDQMFGYSFGDIDDSMFLEDWSEADFTDIALDWQSMLPASGMMWSSVM